MLAIYIFPQLSTDLPYGAPVWYYVETQHVSGAGHGFVRIQGTYQWSELCKLLKDTEDPARAYLLGIGPSVAPSVTVDERRR